MKQPFQRHLRIIALLVATIPAFIIVPPIVQFIIAVDDHGLRRRINPACNGDGRIEGHGDGHVEPILDVFYSVLLFRHHHYGEMNILTILPDQ